MTSSYGFDKDIMIDLETTGTRPGCAILSIGACTLDRSESFYSRIWLPSCHAVGLRDEHDTLTWWSTQAREVYEEAFSVGKSEAEVPKLFEMLSRLSIWLGAGTKRPKIWGNGADFDAPILRAAYEAFGLQTPWKFWDVRCYRTMKALYSDVVPAPDFIGQKHNAIHDAQFQAAHLHKILRVQRSLVAPFKPLQK